MTRMGTDNRIPTFETERLVLSPVTLEDVADIEKYFVDHDVVRYRSRLLLIGKIGNSNRCEIMDQRGGVIAPSNSR